MPWTRSSVLKANWKRSRRISVLRWKLPPEATKALFTTHRSSLTLTERLALDREAERHYLEEMNAILAEFDGLGFYNGGETAGASQPHKHLQIVPLPLLLLSA